MLKRKYLIILLVISIIFTTGCSVFNDDSEASNKEVSEQRIVFGDIMADITIFDESKTAVFEEIFTRLEEIESKMTFNKEASEIIDINNAAGTSSVEVSQETYDLIEESIKYSEISSGKFDVTIGPLVDLWDIWDNDLKPTRETLPSEEEIVTAKNLINYKKISFNEEETSIKLEDEKMKIDLGSIAKGYAADEVIRILKENNIDKAIFNLGGNIYVLGSKNETDDWKVGIQNPLEPTGSYLGIVNVSNVSIVTSGTYERFIIVNDQKYHHILDPDTGYPVENNLQSVSIISKSSTDADAYSTTLFGLGLDQGLTLANELDNLEAIFVTKENDVYLSDGLKNNFELLRNDFEIINN